MRRITERISDYSMYYEKSYRLRKRFIEIFSKLGFGHLTTVFSEAEIMIALFEGIMRFDDSNKPVDKFVLSKGHGAGLVYPILEDMGILSSKEIDETVCIGGDLKGIRDYVIPGFEFYGGSLGIGIGMASGLALGLRQNREDGMVFCLCGDAECYEGSVWEAMLFAAHYRLNNLVVIVDRNYMGVSNFTENMCELEPFADKWRSCNWSVKEVDGHSYEDLFPVLEEVYKRKSHKPLCIIADTVKGKGLTDMSNIPLKHGFMPTGEEAIDAINKLEYINL